MNLDPRRVRFIFRVVNEICPGPRVQTGSSTAKVVPDWTQQSERAAEFFDVTKQPRWTRWSAEEQQAYLVQLGESRSRLPPAARDNVGIGQDCLRFFHADYPGRTRCNTEFARAWLSLILLRFALEDTFPSILRRALQLLTNLILVRCTAMSIAAFLLTHLNGARHEHQSDFQFTAA
jgi:hypothetical protein